MNIGRHLFKVTGNCVLPAGVLAQATVVCDTRTRLIVEVKSPTKDCDVYLPDCYVLPGKIDPHVHGRQDVSGKEANKEDFTTLGAAALNGGVVHVAEMGNNPVPPIDDSSYLAKRELTKTCAVPVTLYAMMGPETRPLSFAVPYKLCHARTTGSNDIIFFPNRAAIEKTASRYRGLTVSHHAEDLMVLATHAGASTHELRRPPEAELSAIEYAVRLTKALRLKSKVCHCSVCRGIRTIVAAKRRCMDITSEVTPHHLFFDTSMITEENKLRMRMNPPLRSPDDRKYCIGALKRGEIDMIASDHAPHTDDDRQGANPPSGHPHLDTLGAFDTWLMVEHRFTPHDIARVGSTKPAEFLNPFLDSKLFGRGYGKIATGYMASLTVLNMRRPVTVSKEKLRTKCKWSPFEGFTFPGSVECTIVGGVLHTPIMR